MNQVTHALTNFTKQALALSNSTEFFQEYDHEWRSECETHRDGDVTGWKPCAQAMPIDFSGLANAADAAIHPDIQAYYGSFWSGGLFAKSSEGPVNLIQLWNAADFDRLVENLVGHLFTQQRAKLAFTVFFATTDEDSELFLSIDNQSGKILLEEPGRPPIREVESDITTFLNRLEPILPVSGTY